MGVARVLRTPFFAGIDRLIRVAHNRGVVRGYCRADTRYHRPTRLIWTQQDVRASLHVSISRRLPPRALVRAVHDFSSFTLIQCADGKKLRCWGQRCQCRGRPPPRAQRWLALFPSFFLIDSRRSRVCLRACVERGCSALAVVRVSQGTRQANARIAPGLVNLQAGTGRSGMASLAQFGEGE